MSASGGYGACRVAEAIVGGGDLSVGARVRELLRSRDRRRRRTLARLRHGVAWDGSEAVGKFASREVPLHQVMDPKFREGFAQLAPLGLSFEVMAVSSATTGCDRPRARLSGHHDHPQSCRRRFSGLGLMPATVRRSSPAGARTFVELAKCPNVILQAWRPRHGLGRFRLPRARHPAVVGRTCRRVATVYRDLHRSLRRQPLHVREQLPAGQAVVRLHRTVERVQTHHRQCIGNRKDRALQRHRGEGVSH